MLKTNKQKGIFVGIITAVFSVYTLVNCKTLVGVGLELLLSTLPGFYLAYWVYNLEKKKDTNEDS